MTPNQYIVVTNGPTSATESWNNPRSLRFADELGDDYDDRNSVLVVGSWPSGTTWVRKPFASLPTFRRGIGVVGVCGTGRTRVAKLQKSGKLTNDLERSVAVVLLHGRKVHPAFPF